MNDNNNGKPSQLRDIRIAYLDGSRLARALRAGMHAVIADQERLNKINVFPVPDGDTGTNLALTMQSMLASLDRSDNKHAGQLLTDVADAALDGGRGNSGAILSQFFLGVADGSSGLRVLSVPELAASLDNGATYAMDAMMEPKEGTILTVMRDFALSITDWAVNALNNDVAAMLEHGLTEARAALARTTEQMEVLKKAGVVDAGAQGFVDFLQGIAHFITTGEIPELSQVMLDANMEEDINIGEALNLEHRYCTEVMVTGNHIDRRKLREDLSAIGSSLVVAGTHRKIKVHIHVNEPANVFAIAEKYGSLGGKKADDMQMQAKSIHGSQSVVIVTDSAADITDEDFDNLNIHMVPLRLHFGERSYMDKVSISADEFYEMLRNDPEPPKTSQPAPGDFRRQYQHLATHFQAVVSINLTAGASGTFRSAETAAGRVDGPGKLFVIDSKNVSLGQGLIVTYAAERAAAGYDADQVVLAVHEIIPKTQTFGLLATLEYAVRGGRVPRSKKILADLLRLNPVLATCPDGRVDTAGVLPGKHNLKARFAKFVARRTDAAKSYRAAVGYAQNRDQAEELVSMLENAIPDLQSCAITETGSVLGAHGGPGSLIVGIQEFVTPGAK